MVILIFFFLLIAASVGIYMWLSSPAGTRLWKKAFLLTLGIGIIRTATAVFGTVILENESNWLQVPAYVMALARLPEAAILPEAMRSSHLILGLVIFLGSGVWIFGIAAIAARSRKRNPSV
jgi:hypothetical protein